MRSATIAAVMLTGLGVLLGHGAPAVAADNGFFLGAGVTDSKIDRIGGNVDLQDSSYKIIAGIRPLDWLGAELNYIDLGSKSAGTSAASTHVKSRAVAAYAVAYLGLDPLPFDLYAKAGLARWNLDACIGGVISGLNGSTSGTDFAYGAGGQVRFGSIGVRLEYERFDLENSSGAKLYSLGLTWTFL